MRVNKGHGNGMVTGHSSDILAGDHNNSAHANGQCHFYYDGRFYLAPYQHHVRSLKNQTVKNLQ